MKRFSFSSLRARLLLIVAVAIIPALGLMMYTASEQRRLAAARIQENQLRLARIASANEEQLIEAARQTLTTLAQLPQVREQDSRTCGQLLADLLKKFPLYANFGAAKPDGDIFCSARPTKGTVNVADRDYFQRALQRRDFAVGQYQIGRITGKPAINLGYPVLASDGTAEAVVFAALDLTWLKQLVAKAPLRQGSTLSVIDHDGTILVRYPDGDQWVGKSVSRDILNTVNARHEGVGESLGSDGSANLIAFTSLGNTAVPGHLHLTVEIPEAVAFTGPNRILTRNLVGLGIVSILALLAVWFGTDLFVLRRVNALVSATKQLTGGDLSARSGLSYGEEELSQLARTFDEMAETLQKRQVEAEQAQKTLKVRAWQQMIVAGFGQHALATTDVSVLMDEAVRLLAQTLEVEYSKVLELLPDGQALLLRAGVGWKEGYVGQATVGTGSDSQAGYTLQSGKPVIVEDLRTETRFKGPPLLLEHGVVSGMSVVIPGKHKPFGVLGAHTARRRVFTDDDIYFLQTVANILAEAIGRRQAEEKFGRLLEFAPDAILGVDRDGRIAIVNAQTERLFGYSREELLGQSVETLIPERFRKRHLGHRASYVLDPRTRPMGSSLELSGRRKDGSEFPVEISLSPMETEEGLFVSAIIRDITERKQAEQRMTALRDVDQAITSTLDLHAVLHILLEKTSHLLPLIAATTVRLLNGQTGELEPVACSNMDEQEWKARTAGFSAEGLSRMLPRRNEPAVLLNVQSDPHSLAPDLLRKYGLVSAFRIPLIAKDEIIGIVTFFTKEEHQFAREEVELLTTLASQAAIAIYNSQLFEQTKSQAAELEKSNKVKDEFLSVMSHELRTPLNVIMGYTGMIKDKLLGEINPEQEQALDKVVVRSVDLLDMIGQILQATSIEAQAAKVESHAVHLHDFLDNLRSNYKAAWNKKEVGLVWDYPSDLPIVETDSEKLNHILQNLVNNAMKFTSEGRVTLTARYLQEQGVLEFKVADTGTGIPKEALPFIFERFHQVDSSETRRYGGVGMGLYIVKKFTEMLRGKVEVESEPGKGSTFTVAIPCQRIER